MADIPSPYRPYDLIQSGLDSAGSLVSGIEERRVQNEPEHPWLRAFIQQKLATQGVPPEAIGPVADGVINQLNADRAVRNKMAPGTPPPPGAPPGLLDESNLPLAAPPPALAGPPAQAAEMPAQGGLLPQAAPQAASQAQAGPLIPPVGPGAPQGYGTPARAQATQIMGGGVAQNQTPMGPAQQGLMNTPSMPRYEPPPPQATAARPAAPVSDGGRMWTKGDTARLQGSLPAIIAAEGRTEAARLSAETRERVAAKKDMLARDLADFRAKVGNSQALAKLESSLQRADIIANVQDRNNFYDFSAQLLGLEMEAARMAQTLALKQGDWQMEALKIQAQLSGQVARLQGSIASSLNYMDPFLKAQLESLTLDFKDRLDNIMRGGDLIAAQRGQPELFRPEGATNRAGETLQQGTPPIPGAPAPSAAPTPAPAPQARKPAPVKKPVAPAAKKEATGANAEADELENLMKGRK